MDPDFKDFLSGLLNKTPSQRLSWPDLMHHPFIADAHSERFVVRLQTNTCSSFFLFSLWLSLFQTTQLFAQSHVRCVCVTNSEVLTAATPERARLETNGLFPSPAATRKAKTAAASTAASAGPTITGFGGLEAGTIIRGGLPLIRVKQTPPPFGTPIHSLMITFVLNAHLVLMHFL
jgi:serine/threonine protein kinase